MRLGAPLFKKYSNPDEWVSLLKSNGYRAALCPVGIEADDETIRAYGMGASGGYCYR